MNQVSGRNDCLYLGQVYAEGDKVSGYVHRMVCKAGEWHDVDNSEDSGLSLEYNYH